MKRFFTLVVLIFIILTADARLKIINQSSIDIIHAKCTGSFPPVSITKAYPVNITWDIVEMIIGGNEGSCVFYDGHDIIAGSSLILSNDLSSAEIIDFQLYKPTVKVKFSTSTGILNQDISVWVCNLPTK